MRVIVSTTGMLVADKAQKREEVIPILNKDKCYTQQKQRLTITVSQSPPKNWLSDFYQRLAEQLKLNDEAKQAVFDYQTEENILLTEKEIFFKALDKHIGEQSTYTFKPQLLESLGTLYALFAHPKTTHEQKQMIASGINEDVNECTPGFNNRVNFIIIRFNMPQNMDELIALARFHLVNRIASIIAANNTQVTIG